MTKEEIREICKELIKEGLTIHEESREYSDGCGDSYTQVGLTFFGEEVGSFTIND